MVTIGEVRGVALGEFGGVESGRPMVESHQPVRLVEGKWLQQHTVHNTEDGRRRADSQCEGEDRARSEPPILGQDSPRKSHVCRQIGKDARATDVAARLFDLVEAPRRQAHLAAHVGF